MSVYDDKKKELVKEPITLIRMKLPNGEYLFSEHEKKIFIGAMPFLKEEVYLGQEIQGELTLNSKVTLKFVDDFNR